MDIVTLEATLTNYPFPSPITHKRDLLGTLVCFSSSQSFDGKDDGPFQAGSLRIATNRL